MHYQGRVRIVGEDEEENVMELCHSLHQENGMFLMNDDKVRTMLARAFDQQGGILAGIGPKGKLEGLMYLLLSSFWYSNDPQWEELFLYVTPEHRKSRNAVELLKFAKWCADDSGFPLFIGVLSSKTTERKELLYERYLQHDGNKKELPELEIIQSLTKNFDSKTIKSLVHVENGEQHLKKSTINFVKDASSLVAQPSAKAGGRFFVYQGAKKVA